MGRPWYLHALIPLAVLLAISLYRPVRLEPKLIMSGTGSRFVDVVAASGGPNRVRIGFYFDFAFIAVFAAIVPAPLFVGHGWWVVPTLAAALDVTEDVIALALLGRIGSAMALRCLWVVAFLKLSAYVGTVAAVVAAVSRNR
jgi:hypothetical protein